MANKQVHLDQAKHNEEAALQLKETEYYDWGCTAAFYSALHYVEAKFNDDPKVVHTEEVYKKTNTVRKDEDYSGGVHALRAALVGRSFPKADAAYRNLLAVSKLVRYVESNKIATLAVNKTAADRLISEDLAAVKTELGINN